MEKDGLAKSSDTSLEKEGFISQSLSKDGIPNQSLSDDHIGIENISVEPNKLYEAVSALRNYGFNYLQCQGGYDEGPGKNLVRGLSLSPKATTSLLSISTTTSPTTPKRLPVSVVITCVPINSDLNHKRSLGTELERFLLVDVLDKLINTFLSF